MYFLTNDLDMLFLILGQPVEHVLRLVFFAFSILLSFDEVSRICIFGTCLYFLVSGVKFGVKEILRNRVVKDDRFLHDKRTFFSEIVKIIIFQVLTVE
jgi:hypothetical protein